MAQSGAVLTDAVIAELKTAVGAGGWVEDPVELSPFLREWRGLYRGSTPLMLQPASRDAVSAALRICQRHRIAVIPQGGNTGLVGGAMPGSTPERPEILLSARRLNRIVEVDAANFSLTAEAGCVLAALQTAAASSGRLFPLSLASEGSCQLGGIISTNAGGTAVLRYGNMRSQVLGLEVVLPDGRVFEGLRALRKDNTGYDLKQLFIGAEGTLGFITAAVCRLYPAADSVATAMVAVRDPETAVALYAEARYRLGDELVAFELMNRRSLELVLKHMPDRREPLGVPHPWYVLLETSGAAEDAEARLEQLLGEQLAAGRVLDGAVARSGTQRERLWALRHDVSEAQKHEGGSIKHDIAVPVSAVPRFIERASAGATAAAPGVQVVAFGHLGDGNIHFNLGQPAGVARDAWLACWEALSTVVHDIALELGGTFSAEHGIGRMKAAELVRRRPPVEIALMRTLKEAFDPAGIMNPGRLLPEPGQGPPAA